MKKLKIEIQFILLTVSIAVAVIVSGYLVYKSLSQIVDSINKEARPDLKLLLIKDISAELNEAENTIRIYSLSKDQKLIKPFRKLNIEIRTKLNKLEEYGNPETTEIIQIDSIRLLVTKKLLIIDNLRILYQSKGKTNDNFSTLYSKIDTVLIQPDTIKFEKEEKKGFFKRVFGKKDTTTKSPVIIDKSKEKEIIKQEIAGIEQQITDQSRLQNLKEKDLLDQNIAITEILNHQITKIENSEQNRLEIKIQEADSMAARTKNRLAVFTIAAVFLLIIVLILFFRNLRQSRTYQQVLRKAKSEAESLAKAKEIFVATVSHEMRTPVNVIFGLTEQMRQKPLTDEAKDDLEIVHKSAGHLISLVNDTLDFSKIESQKLKIEQIDFLPEEVFQEVYALHKNLAKEKGIELNFDYPVDKGMVIKGDPVRLKQILINLIANAIKFTNQGEIRMLASLEETSGEARLLHIQITDTGIGMKKEDQQKIFDEFVQLDTDLKQKQRGTGLGLAIVKKLIDLQNGTIDVESVPDAGTKFTLQIPYLKGESDALKIGSIEHLNIPTSFSNLNFLIVDDEEFNLYLIKNILNKWGVSYSVANNGQEATELAIKNSYDLILMDIRMPLMNGYEAAKKIFQQRPDSKIIALTATNKQVDINNISSSGIQFFLQKPFTELELLNAVIKILPPEFTENLPDEDQNNPPVIFDELERMTGGDQAFLSEMLKIFIRSSENGLAAILRNFQIADWNAIAEASHKLAAPAKHMNISLYNNLKSLEQESAGNIDINRIKNLIDQIEKEIKLINTFLSQKLSEE